MTKTYTKKVKAKKMMYDISEYINPKDPLYIKGCIAIKSRNSEKLNEVINHPDFDCASYEARGLLFCAAENINIDAFHQLGDANVVLFDPLKILKQRQHILSYEYYLRKQKLRIQVIIITMK